MNEDMNLQSMPNQGDNSSFKVAEYLTAATEAAANNHKRLAIHLFIAAFELENIASMIPSEPVLTGMRRAWQIAVEIGDKSSAETIFVTLSPYSSPEQVQERVAQLQDMAVSQLREMGVPGDRIKRMTPIHTADATKAGADPNFMQKLRDALNTDISQLEDEDVGLEVGFGTDLDMDDEPPVHLDGFGVQKWDRAAGDDGYIALTYDELVGYDSEIQKMRVYGFESAGDLAYRKFVQASSEFHGISDISLNDPFLFYGPSRDDVYEFAEATAGELGYPVVSLHVRTDDEGMWTMRLSGPFHRSIIGVSDPTDVPTPCTFLIENMDLLQEFIKASIRHEATNPEEMYMGNRHSYGELLGYIHTMMHKPDVHAILTSKNDLKLGSQFMDMFDRLQRVEVCSPTPLERLEFWQHFAQSHASFAQIDLERLAELSEGVSRHDLETAGRNAVRVAYQESLNTNEQDYLDIKDVLIELVPFMSAEQGSALMTIENVVAEAFMEELEGFTFEDKDPKSSEQ